ncbi:MAG: transglycosylase domain-containing protein [Clostridia bacterium]|nr:transglycosylase domain-containing protein [Clostridia bacterium]
MLTFFLSCTLTLLIVGSLGVIAATVFALRVPARDLKEELFLIGVRDRTTRLYYEEENGTAVELAADRISGHENALYCRLEDMAPDLKNAFIAIEDKRFYEHGGIDWLRTLSAARHYLSGDASFGGSTITQQLVKNLTGEAERSAARKVGELMRAAALEKRLSKDAILEQYLNVVNLAENCYGVRTAANTYFSKEPMDLTLVEAATIAAITNNPAKYDPIKHPRANRTRRDLILGEMQAQGMIDEATMRAAIATDTVLHVNESAMTGRVNSWFADMAVSDVIDDLVSEKGYTRAEASRLVYAGGLRIYLTVNPEMQRKLTAYYEDTANFPTHTGGLQANSAMMVVNPQNGDILAVAGAVGKKTSNRVQNYATDTKRPSGSVIKPLSVYAPALERGIITTATVFDDIPLSYRENGAPWPRNSPNLYRGLTTVGEALAQSVNTVAVSLLSRLGSREAYRFLTNELGFTSLDAERDLGAASLALGQQHTGVSLRELLGGYTALAGGGVCSKTRSYTRVLDSNGEVLLEKKTEGRRVLSAETAEITTLLLRRAISEGTGAALTLRQSASVAGKTGTSSGNCDKWFVGYTPTLLAGVWYGYDTPASVADLRGNHALAIFDKVMGELLTESDYRTTFPSSGKVSAVRVCRDSGLLLSEACYHDPRGDRSEIAYFKKGSEPTAHCHCHVLVDYCEAGQGLAHEGCDPAYCRKVALVRASRAFPRQIKVLDAPYTYGGTFRFNGRNLIKNEPYYAIDDDTKRFYGVEMGVVPFNRACPGHIAQDDFWARREELTVPDAEAEN